jgi:two-component system, LuxR family, response regulator FixJ
MAHEPKVHIIDDDQAVRDSLAFLLQSIRIPTTVHESASSFLAALTVEHQGCIITDVRMPDISGIDLLRRVQELKVQMPVIVITGHGDVPLAVEAMKLGAFDFFEKPFDDEAIVSAVRLALDRLKQTEKASADRAELEKRLASLSSREREVLDGLIAGHANKVIASDLAISPRTVEIYRANVMTKMQAGSLSELVRMAITAGLTGTG